MTTVYAIIRNTTGFCSDVSDLTLHCYKKLFISPHFEIDERLYIEELLEFTFNKFDDFTKNMHCGSIEFQIAIQKNQKTNTKFKGKKYDNSRKNRKNQ